MPRNSQGLLETLAKKANSVVRSGHKYLQTSLLSVALLAPSSCGNNPGNLPPNKPTESLPRETPIESLFLNFFEDSKHLAQAHSTDGTTYNYWEGGHNQDDLLTLRAKLPEGDEFLLVFDSRARPYHFESGDDVFEIEEFSPDGAPKMVTGLRNKSAYSQKRTSTLERTTDRDICSITHRIANRVCDTDGFGTDDNILRYLFNVAVEEGNFVDVKSMSKRLACDAFTWGGVHGNGISGCSDLLGGGFTSGSILVETYDLGESSGPSTFSPSEYQDHFVIYSADDLQKPPQVDEGQGTIESKGKIYWNNSVYDANSQTWVNSFHRSNLDGSNRELIHSEVSGERHLTDLDLDVDNSRIYASTYRFTSEESEIISIGLNGSQPRTLLSEQGIVRAIAASPRDGEIYYTIEKQTGEYSYQDTIKAVSLNGSNSREVGMPTSGSLSKALEIDGRDGTIYFGNTTYGGGGGIIRMGLLTRKNIYPKDCIYPGAIALDSENNSMYWTEPAVVCSKGPVGRIMGLDLGTGTTYELIGSQYLGNKDPWDLEVDDRGRKIYWSEKLQEGRILRSNLDGSGQEVLIPNLDGAPRFELHIEN